MSDGYAFSERSAKRIGDAVRRVERMPQRRAGGRLPPPAPAETSFWARLTTRSLDGRRHSWIRVRPDGAGGWQPYDPPVEGELNAVEINGHLGIPAGAIVRLHLTDFDEDRNPLYTFQFETVDQQAPMRIHDHRDNFNGGFSFSVFHPGTSLPMQQWGI